MMSIGKSRPAIRLVLFTGAVLLFGIGYYWGNKHKQPAQLNVTAVQFRQPVEFDLSGLSDHTGAQLTTEQLTGRWGLLVLPNKSGEITQDSLNLMYRTRNRLGDRPEFQAKLLFLFLDPSGDARLGERLKPYGDNFIAIGSGSASGDRLVSSLGVSEGAGRQPQFSPVYVINPDIEVVGLYTGTPSAADIAEDLRRFSDNY